MDRTHRDDGSDAASAVPDPHAYSYGVSAPDAATGDAGPGIAGARDEAGDDARVRAVPTDLRPAEPIPGAGEPRPRPHAPAPADASGARPRRRLLIGSAVVAAVVVLALLVGAGVVLATRPWEGGGPDAAGTTSPASPATRSAIIGGVTVTVESLETAVPFAGSGAGQVDPDGEFVALLVTVDNASDATLFWDDDVLTLVDQADGRHPQDVEATAAYETDARTSQVIPAGGTTRIAAVFDVPIGTAPSSVDIALSIGGTAETGSLPLTP